MGIRQLSDAEVFDLVGTRDGVADIEYPPQGLQPYHGWLVRTLHRLAQGSAGALRVWPSDASDTSVYVAPGRASIGGTALSHAGGDVDLAPFNNATAHVWLYSDAGQARIGVGPSTSGWPGQAHIKLAEVALSAGTIVSILDRRFETFLRI